MRSSQEVGPALLERVKEAHRQFPTGVTIVTASAEGKPYGLAVNAFSSVSLEPPVVLACVAATSSTHPHLFAVDNIAVNILSEEQAPLLASFAKSGGDKFADVPWREGRHGSPILEESSAHFELRIEKRLQAYTHTIFIGRVLDAGVSAQPPVIYLGGELFSSAGLPQLEAS